MLIFRFGLTFSTHIMLKNVLCWYLQVFAMFILYAEKESLTWHIIKNKLIYKSLTVKNALGSIIYIVIIFLKANLTMLFKIITNFAILFKL